MREMRTTSTFVNGKMIFYKDYADEEFAIIDGVLIAYNNDEAVVRIPEGVTKINTLAFNGCHMREVIIPASVKSIEARAFEDCRELESVSIPTGVEVLNNATFMRCWSLKEVLLPISLRVIQDGVFLECTSLNKIIIPETVESIGEGAFFSCFSLEEIALPQSLKEIGDNCFQNCGKLKMLEIPETIKKIGKSAVPRHVKLMVNIDGNPTSYLAKSLQYAKQYVKKIDVSDSENIVADIKVSKKTDESVAIITRDTTIRILRVMTMFDDKLWMDYARFTDEKGFKALLSEMKQWEKSKKDKKKDKEDKLLLANVRGALMLNDSKFAEKYFIDIGLGALYQEKDDTNVL